jgi:hypothetical protein
MRKSALINAEGGEIWVDAGQVARAGQSAHATPTVFGDVLLSRDRQV